jgi:phage terminase large subunit-like protein
VADYGALEAYVCGLAERFRVEGIAIDPWNSVGTQTRLLEEGLPVVRFRQGYASLSPAMKETERLILSGQLRHDGNPVMRWCVANTAVAMDPAGNIKPDRARSREKIDGAVALIMAIGVASASPGASVYEERPSFLTI